MESVQKIKDQEIAPFGITESKIVELKKKYAGLVIGDTKTYESCKAARTHVVSIRTTIDKARKEINADYQKVIKDNNSEAKRLTEMVLEVEEPLQKTVKAWESKKAEEKAERERIEAERIEKHKAVISRIAELGMLPFGAELSLIESNFEELNKIEIGEHLEEFEIEAATAFGKSKFMLEQAIEGEKKEAARRAEQEKEAARLRKERQELEARQAKMREENLKVEAERQQLQAEKDQIEADKQAALKKQLEARKFLADWDEAIEMNKQFDDRKLFEREEAEMHEQQRRIDAEALKPDLEKLDNFYRSVYSFAIENAPALKNEDLQAKCDNFINSLLC